jgi:hypothetical protein
LQRKEIAANDDVKADQERQSQALLGLMLTISHLLFRAHQGMI